MGTTLGALLADPDVAASVRRVDAADLDVAVSGVTADSRRVAQGALFCCITGGSHDGHDYAAAAVAAGAVALLVARPLPLAVPQVLSDDTRRSTALLAAAFHGHPSRSMQVVGVTGTNGKTTTTTLLASILRHAGRPTGVIGTLTGRHTTPEAPELQQVLADFRDAGMSSVVMEVSSHALALHRVDGCRFTLSVFTNLGRDHLDLHGTLERYFAAKASLFTPELTERGLSNCDDPHGRLLADGAPIVTNCFSSHDIDDVAVTPTSHEYTWRGVRVRVGIGGHFNVMNSLAALTAASLLGVAPALRLL
ncbi:MAG: Mur ligase family protein, partial [Ilumatobacteraceae bacterium]